MNPKYEFDPDTIGPWHVREVKGIIQDELGKNLAKYRKKNGETISELAKALDISKATISNYENGMQEIPASLLPIITARYNISISELYGEPLPVKQTLEYDLFFAMVSNLLRVSNDEWMDLEHFNIMTTKYFQMFMTTEAANSFDVFYALSNFLEQLKMNSEYAGISNKDKNQQAYELLKRSMERIQDNNYRITPSIFLDKIIENMKDSILE